MLIEADQDLPPEIREPICYWWTDPQIAPR